MEPNFDSLYRMASYNISYLYMHTAGMDYTAVSRNLAFNGIVSFQMVTIPILDDLIVERSEIFTLTLTSTDPAVVLNSSSITIEDTDSELL